MHLCSCFKIERAACDALLDAQLVMRTFMPIYYNPNLPPAKGTDAYDDYGTKHDQELRDEIIGTVIVQNIMIPTGPCCASPTGCPLNMSIDLKPEYADKIDDDEKMMLALFTQVAVPLTPSPPGCPSPVEVLQGNCDCNPSPDAYTLPLPCAYFTEQTLRMISYGAMGYGMSGTDVQFVGIFDSFTDFADTGDLIPKLAGV